MEDVSVRFGNPAAFFACVEEFRKNAFRDSAAFWRRMEEFRDDLVTPPSFGHVEEFRNVFFHDSAAIRLIRTWNYS